MRLEERTELMGRKRKVNKNLVGKHKGKRRFEKSRLSGKLLEIM
jgi:hypothetical protein